MAKRFSHLPFTESKWLSADWPQLILDYLREHSPTRTRGVMSRKVRLDMVDCCRRIWHLLPEEGKKAVEVAERFAEGQATDAERAATLRVAREAERRERAPGTRVGTWQACYAACSAVVAPARYAASQSLFAYVAAGYDDVLDLWDHPERNPILAERIREEELHSPDLTGAACGRSRGELPVADSWEGLTKWQFGKVADSTERKFRRAKGLVLTASLPPGPRSGQLATDCPHPYPRVPR